MINRQKLIEELVSESEHWKRGYPYEDGILGGLSIAIRYIKAQPPADVPDINVGEWIPCSERLPERYQKVLVTAPRMQTVLLKEPTYFVDIGHCDFEGKFNLSTARTRQYAEAWMPLPEPYKGVE